MTIRIEVARRADRWLARIGQVIAFGFSGKFTKALCVAWCLFFSASFSYADSAEPASSKYQTVVIGEKSPLGPIKAPSVAGSTIRRDQLDGPALQASDVLRTQPGLLITESGGLGAPSTAAIRGASAASVPIYLADVRLNDDVGGTADLSMVPLWLINHIEIYRGNAPLESDRLGPGGAIFFVPQRPVKNAARLGLEGGSWGAKKVWGSGALRLDPVGILAGMSYQRADNDYTFSNDQGMLLAPQSLVADSRKNADEHSLDSWGIAHAKLGKRISLEIVANHFSRERGVPRLALLPSRQAREQATRTLVSLGVRIPWGVEQRLALESRTSLLYGKKVYKDPLKELSLRAPHLEIAGQRIAHTFGAELSIYDTLHIHSAIDLAHERISRDPNEEEIPLGRAHREFARLAINVENRFTDWLSLHLLASGECHHTGLRNSFCDALEPTGRIGIQFHINTVSILTNVGRYVRVPTLGELYGVSGTIHGNGNLESESGFSADLGIRAKTTKKMAFFRQAYADAFVFAQWSDGLIAYRRTGQGFVTPYNVGRARVLGVELTAGLAITPIIKAEISATALDPRDTSPDRSIVNNILPYRSRLITGPRIRVDWKNQPTSFISSLGGEVRAQYQSSRYVDPAGLGVIGEQTSVNLEAFSSFFQKAIMVRARIADLFDSQRTDIIGYPLPGRSIYFGIETSL